MFVVHLILYYPLLMHACEEKIERETLVILT